MWILCLALYCLAEDSLETSSLIFSQKQIKKYQWMSSAAVVVGALWVGLNNILFKYNLYIHTNDTSNTGFDSKHNAYI